MGSFARGKMNKMSLLYLYFYSSFQMFLLERSVSNGATPMRLFHCILVLFCTSPTRMGHNRTETQRADLHPYVPVPLYTSPILYQSHETGTKGGLRQMVDLHPSVSLSQCTWVLFCTSPMRMGQKGLRHRGLTSIPMYQSHETGTKGDWDWWLTSIPTCPCPTVY